MLILSRKENESILIGDDIHIKICRVSGKSVRIGLQAPRDVKITRGELCVSETVERDSTVELAICSSD